MAEAVLLLTAGTAFVNQTSFRPDVTVGGVGGTLERTAYVHKRFNAVIASTGGVTEIRMIGTAVPADGRTRAVREVVGWTR